METKVRKLGTDEFLVISHSVEDCPFCEAARAVTGSGVIFLEDDLGNVQRVEVEMGADLRCVMLCRQVTRARAIAEISTAAPS